MPEFLQAFFCGNSVIVHKNVPLVTVADIVKANEVKGAGDVCVLYQKSFLEETNERALAVHLHKVFMFLQKKNVTSVFKKKICSIACSNYKDVIVQTFSESVLHQSAAAVFEFMDICWFSEDTSVLAILPKLCGWLNFISPIEAPPVLITNELCESEKFLVQSARLLMRNQNDLAILLIQNVVPSINSQNSFNEKQVNILSEVIDILVQLLKEKPMLYDDANMYSTNMHLIMDLQVNYKQWLQKCDKVERVILQTIKSNKIQLYNGHLDLMLKITSIFNNDDNDTYFCAIWYDLYVFRLLKSISAVGMENTDHVKTAFQAMEELKNSETDQVDILSTMITNILNNDAQTLITNIKLYINIPSITFVLANVLEISQLFVMEINMPIYLNKLKSINESTDYNSNNNKTHNQPYSYYYGVKYTALLVAYCTKYKNTSLQQILLQLLSIYDTKKLELFQQNIQVSGLKNIWTHISNIIYYQQYNSLKHVLHSHIENAMDDNNFQLALYYAIFINSTNYINHCSTVLTNLIMNSGDSSNYSITNYINVVEANNDKLDILHLVKQYKNSFELHQYELMYETALKIIYNSVTTLAIIQKVTIDCSALIESLLIKPAYTDIMRFLNIAISISSTNNSNLRQVLCLIFIRSLARTFLS